MWTLCNEDGGVGEGDDHGGDARDGVDCHGKMVLVQCQQASLLELVLPGPVTSV